MPSLPASRLSRDELARQVRSSLWDWQRIIPERDMRRIANDPRALFLASVIVGLGTVEQHSLDEARGWQARCLIHVRACQLTGRFSLAATILKRASVYGKTRKPIRRILAAMIAEDRSNTLSQNPISYKLEAAE